MKLYQMIAGTLNACENCRKSNNPYFDIHTETLESIQKNALPHGSGIDSGCTIDLDKSTDKRIIIYVPYHCMNENGYYDGWRDFIVYVTPSMIGNFDLRITGRDYNGVKDYLYQLFDEVLSSEYVRE